MPGKTKKSKKKGSKKAVEKKTEVTSLTNVKVGDIVTFDAKSVIITNLDNNNDSNEKNLEVVESAFKVTENSLDDAFIDDQANNNCIEKTTPVEKPVELIHSKDSSPVLRKRRTPKREECKTIQDFVDYGVPRHIAEMKHPLGVSWTFWYHGNSKLLTWDENFRELVSVGSVEDFWAVHNYLELASKLEPGCDYSFFRAGVRPDWEDPVNLGGGRWHICSPLAARESGQLDLWWRELLLLLIGGMAGGYEEILNGVVVNIKNKQDKLAMWISESKDTSAVMGVGSLLKRALGISEKIVFSVHTEDRRKMRNGSGSSPGKISL